MQVSQVLQLSLDNRYAEETRMNNEQIKELCLSLIKADTEDEVIKLLTDAGYWKDQRVWRFYSDYENNYNTIGNQQSRPEAALVEKLVNAVDARLMNECLVRGIDPQGPSAPQTIQEAVARFFEEDANPERATAGLIREWGDSKRAEVAKGITLAATGTRSSPCFTISDCGEGQTPEMIPETFVSLTKSNKLRIPFVQGKFNMGGTGVLKFCGRHGLQLIVSRRNPQILSGNSKHESDVCWGFTIVRREDPTGNRRSSVYAYLAPMGAEMNPQKGGVLRFSADSMPIFPEEQDAYARGSKHGTLIKLYEYSTRYRTNMMLDGGILRPLDLLLADVALPIRLYECRDYKGHAGSFETTLTGIKVRLEDDKARNLETDFPASFQLKVAGEQMTATIYAFRKGKAGTYRSNEGIIFTINGQTHGHLTTDFFRRKKVGLGYLRDSILVIVDCSQLSGRAREDLFMNSRDRLSEGDLRNAIESELEDLLKRHEGLRELKERRRREELESKLDDSRPLEEILESLLKESPTLSALFLEGKRVSTPFKAKKVQSGDKPFQGERYPTYFRFTDKEYGETLYRNCHINYRCRITFETDAVNDYFARDVDPGTFELRLVSGNNRSPVEDYSINLQNGIATLNVRLPANCRVGDELCFSTTVTDRTQLEPFENRFVVDVLGTAKPSVGGGGRRRPPTDTQGNDRELPSGITLPNIIEVSESEWETKDPPFDQYTALRIIHAGPTDENGEGENGKDIYDCFINMDNAFLKSELKSETQRAELLRARFKYGMVLVGLGLLHDDAQRSHKQDEEGDKSINGAEVMNIEDKVEAVTRAISPVLLPMIESLGGLELEDE